MRNFNVGSIMGIPIKLNMTLVIFLPVLAWLISRPAQIQLYAELIGEISPHAIDAESLTRGQTPIIIGLMAAVGLFASVLLHELGHSWTARRYGIPIASITLWIFGGMAHIDELPEDWKIELKVALTGPITSAGIAVVCYGLLQVLPSYSMGLFIVGWLAVINVMLAVFNMLPAFPMDGGRILRSLLAQSRPYVEATRIAAAVGKGVAVLLAIYAVLAFAPLLLLIAMFIYIAASSESRATVIRDLLSGMTVRDIMSTDIQSIVASTTVDELASRILSERASAFPVREGERIVGLVSLDDLRKIDETDRQNTTVSEIMTPSPTTVTPDTDAFEAMRRLSQDEADQLVVVENDRTLGTVTHSDFTKAIEVLQGLGPWRQMKVPDGYA